MPSARKKRAAPYEAVAVEIRKKPAVYMVVLPGQWLLNHATPSWRIADPKNGFQRIVKEQRAKEIAKTVLDENRTFPNAITLATDAKSFPLENHILTIPEAAKFLVVDGQHRLWAQHYSKVNGDYPCIIHMERSEREMATLFLEINDNQRRVPSSLRWDLVRLVRSEDQSVAMTADIVYELATRRESPFYSVGAGIDLTGEKKDMTIKQGSLAPEIKTLIARHLKKNDAGVEDYLGLLIRFFVAIRSLDPDGWGDPQSAFFKARVLRALIRVLSDLLQRETMSALTAVKLRAHLAKIDVASLSNDAVRKMQGSAGVQDLYEQMKVQVLGKKA